MHAIVLLCINQYTKLEVPGFTNYKDMIRAKFKKTGHVTPTTSRLGVICHRRLGFYRVYLHAKFDDFCFSRSIDIIGASKFKVGNLTLTTGDLSSLCWDLT